MMMKKILLAIVLATSLVACSQKYYPEMYQKAGEDASVLVKTEVDSTLHVPSLEEAKDTVAVQSTVVPSVDSVAANATIRETTDTYTTGGVAVQQQYHVVVGSFQSEVNAQNLLITLQKQGFAAQVAVNQNGLFRVFMYSADTEAEIRQALAKARATYPDAWMLKLAR
ncbi:MAG: SPOR domain-containing protein [Paludibacteraceae bacterium]|nr:SPOR domain-containing protein [Paludibacteraceae bacterium]